MADREPLYDARLSCRNGHEEVGPVPSITTKALIKPLITTAGHPKKVHYVDGRGRTMSQPPHKCPRHR